MRSFAPLVLLALAPVAVSAPVPKALKPDDKAALVGTWKVTAVTINGKETGIDTHTFIFDADGGVKTLFGKSNPPSESKWNWTIDPEKTPRAMKWVRTPPANTTWDCVYELNGDTLKVGFLNRGAKPPAAVEPGDNLTLYVMTRDTSK